jgi:CBS domain-containing protein
MSEDQQPILVQDIMTPDPVCLEEEDLLVDAIRIMRERKFGSIVVVAKGRLIFRGILTDKLTTQAAYVERDFEKLKTIKIKEYMIENPQTVSRSDSIMDVLKLMAAQGVDHVVVTDRSIPVGIVSYKNITKAIGENLEET